jgi:hypothetical protein
VGFFGIDDTHYARLLVLAPLVAGGLALSGCVSSPTYGTDKTANEQLFGDLSNAISLSPPKKEKIVYKPRPALVTPAPGAKEALPPPQENITQTASADWPESPEQRRARLRAEATANENDPNYQSGIVDDVQTDPVAVRKAMKESGSSHPPPPDGGKDVQRRGEIKRRLVESKQGDPTSRKYLSEPPLAYRLPADTAPKGELGEDEAKKARRLKKEAEAKSGKKGMFDWLPSW